MSHPDESRPGTSVTHAERQAMDALLRRGTVKGAAGELGKSPATVDHQLRSVRARLGVSTTIEAVRILYVEKP